MARSFETVVLGAGYAGVIASIRYARQGGDVTLVSASDRFCERIRLHQVGSGQDVPAPRIETLLEGSGARFEMHRVESIDLDTRALHCAGREPLGFEQLVLAVGSRSDVDRVPGARAHGYAIADAPEAERLASDVASLAKTNARVLVVGGGLTGIEIATELAESHPSLRITLCSATDPGAGFASAGAAHLHARLANWKIAVVSGNRVERVAAGEATLEGGRRLEFDACVWAASNVPSPLARDAGLAVDEIGRAVLDERLRSLSHPFVSVVGDAGLVLRAPDCPSAMTCQTAMPMGAYVADRLATERRGDEALPFSFSARLRCVSLGRHDAIVQGLDAREAPSDVVKVGAEAAAIKESICQYVMDVFEAERGGEPYVWPAGELAQVSSVAVLRDRRFEGVTGSDAHA